MIVLVEGCNMVGKTTLARQFSEDLQIPYHHFHEPPRFDPYLHFVGQLGEWRRDRHFVLDRCHLTNFAYGTKFDGKVLSGGEWQAIDQQFCIWNTWLFLLVDDPFAISERAKQAIRDDPSKLTLIEPDEIGTIQNRFNHAYEMSSLYPKGTFSLLQLINADQVTDQYQTLLNKIRETHSL